MTSKLKFLGPKKFVLVKYNKGNLLTLMDTISSVYNEYLELVNESLNPRDWTINRRTLGSSHSDKNVFS